MPALARSVQALDVVLAKEKALEERAEQIPRIWDAGIAIESRACVIYMCLWVFEGGSRDDGIKSRGRDFSRGPSPSAGTRKKRQKRDSTNKQEIKRIPQGPRIARMDPSRRVSMVGNF